MKSSLDANDRQFLARLQRLGSGTVQELCGDLGVTATAVRQRLARLQVLNMVTRDVVRSGRGRPHFTYRPTEVGLRELGDNYADLAQILWGELQQIEEIDIRERIISRVRERLAGRLRRFVDGANLNDRVRQLGEALSEYGFDIETETSGTRPVLREHNCPYHELASSDSAICELEQSVFQDVLQANVTLSRCCLDGNGCCEFHTEA